MVCVDWGAEVYNWCVVPETNFDVLFVPGIAIILACLLQNRVQTTLVLIIGMQSLSLVKVTREDLYEVKLQPQLEVVNFFLEDCACPACPCVLKLPEAPWCSPVAVNSLLCLQVGSSRA